MARVVGARRRRVGVCVRVTPCRVRARLGLERRFGFGNGAAEAGEVVFPKPLQEKYEFSAKPVSVFSGEFKTQTKFKLLSTGTMIGKLRYQACSDKVCLPPRTIEVKLPVEVRN